jgi:recombination protein RecT
MARTDGSDVQGKLAKKEDGPVSMDRLLAAVNIKQMIEDSLKERAGQFTASLLSMTKLNSNLGNCDSRTVLYCGLKAAALNLPLDNNLGFAYAVPYGGKAQFQIGYKGLIQLAQRTGLYKSIGVIEVREGEFKKWNRFTEELELDFEVDDLKAPVIGYAARFELTNGFTKTVYWPKSKVEAHGKRFSKTYHNGPWKSDFDAMAKKTVLKDLLGKWGPLSTEMQEAVKYDQAVISKDEAGNEQPEYVDADFSVVDEPTPAPEGPEQQEIV